MKKSADEPQKPRRIFTKFLCFFRNPPTCITLLLLTLVPTVNKKSIKLTRINRTTKR